MVVMAYAYIMHIKLFAARIINIDHKTLDNGTRTTMRHCESERRRMREWRDVIFAKIQNYYYYAQ